MTEKEKMLAGKIYDSTEPELVALRQKAHRLCTEYNQLLETDERRAGVMKELGSVVTRDIPPHSLAVGMPCRVVRTITEEDALEHHPELF